MRDGKTCRLPTSPPKFQSMKPVFSEITYESFELQVRAPLMGQQEEFFCTCQTWLSESFYLTLYTPSKKKGRAFKHNV